MKETTYIFNYPFYYKMNEDDDRSHVVNCNRPIIKNIRFINHHPNNNNKLFTDQGYYIFDLLDKSEINLIAPETSHVKNTNNFVKNTKTNLKLLKQLDIIKKKQIIKERQLTSFNYQ